MVVEFCSIFTLDDRFRNLKLDVFGLVLVRDMFLMESLENSFPLVVLMRELHLIQVLLEIGARWALTAHKSLVCNGIRILCDQYGFNRGRGCKQRRLLA